MAKLIYSAIASLDGYVEDEQGEFGWAAPDDEVFAFINRAANRDLPASDRGRGAAFAGSVPCVGEGSI
jgi:hypothetical protein